MAGLCCHDATLVSLLCLYYFQQKNQLNQWCGVCFEHTVLGASHAIEMLILYPSHILSIWYLSNGCLIPEQGRGVFMLNSEIEMNYSVLFFWTQQMKSFIIALDAACIIKWERENKKRRRLLPISVMMDASEWKKFSSIWKCRVQFRPSKRTQQNHSEFHLVSKAPNGIWHPFQTTNGLRHCCLIWRAIMDHSIASSSSCLTLNYVNVSVEVGFEINWTRILCI